MTVALDHAEQLVAEHEPVAVVRRDPEGALGDLAIGAADADLQRPQEHLARAGPRVRHLGDGGAVRPAGSGDEGLHAQAAVRPPSITNAVPVTNAASSDAR